MPDVVDRLNSALEGRYRIERELGEGGMANVYLADDLKHGRKVALKVLKPDLVAVVGAERFLAEIKTTANLQHPHILPLFDSGEADSFLFYVMPYVEGESLRQRLDRENQLPVESAVGIAISIADALDYAHGAGVIHRDIKPANVLLLRGEPVIADFGIALAADAVGGGRVTETGMSLGTPYYTSPEQATGEPNVGPATDIYSLGCVLYEMLVGSTPHAGSTAQAVLANILTRDAPPPTEARPSIPANVDAAIRKALARLPADRFQSVRLFADALRDPSFRHGGVQEQHEVSNAAGRWKTLAVASSAAAVMSLFALSWATFGTKAITSPVLRVSMALSGEELVVPANGSAVTISPDGSTLLYGAFRGAERDRRRLWTRRLDEFEATPLPGTEEGVTAAFSPDGQEVAFTQGAIRGPIQLVSVAGGPRRSLGDEVLRSGIDWGPDGNIYYVRIGHGISRVRVADGTTEIVTTLDADAGETGHRWIDVLPGGRAGVFSIGRSGVMDGWEIGVVRFGENEHQVLTTGLYPRYVKSGHLLWVMADGTLMAAPFDAKRLELTGQGVPVLDDVNIGEFGAADFAVSENGTLVYLRARSFEETPVWVARDGTETEIPGEWDGALLHPKISPDARRMSLSIQQETGMDIWMKELDAGPLARLTFSSSNYRASWTDDGGALTFLSDRESQGVWQIRADGSGSAAIVYDDERFINEAFTTPDGRWLVYRLGSGGGRDLMARPIAGEGEPVELATTDFEESAAAVSPDTRWLAYMSNESGQNEVYVRPFPSTSESRQQVSTSGGREPVWSRSGSELFYRNASNQLVAVDVQLRPTFVAGDREVLFSTVAYKQSGNISSYDVSPDGQRFLMIRSLSTPGELKLIQNWFDDLNRLVPR